MATSGFDPVRMNNGALKRANNLTFAEFIQGKGTSVEARIRPGRHDWNTDNLYQRFYLAEMEGSEATWTAGAQDLTKSVAGYASRSITHGSATTTDMYRTFSGKDISQGGLSAGLTSHTLALWLRADDPTKITNASCQVILTSDAGPGAPGTWTNKLTLAFSSLSASPAAMTAATWTKFEAALTAFTAAGTFDPTSITGVDIKLVSSGAVVLHADEVYIYSTKNSQTVGLGEFLKASTSNRYLLTKTGDTLYIDKNESLANTKVLSGLNRNRSARFAKVYDQIFMTDGDSMWAVDGTLNGAGVYNYRPMGFPVSTGSPTVTTTGSGSTCTGGVHHVWLNYVYGSGSTRYGQSSLQYLGTITIVNPSDQYRFTGLPVPAESEGVVAKRLWIGLADDAKDAPAYFAGEITPSDTAEDFDQADDVLSTPTNPVGPRDNGVPTAAEYLIPFEGSLVALRLVGNPTGYAWSRPGVDLNSGPEVFPGVNLGISQRGEAWTGAIVRGRIMYMFTRRSVHAGAFDQYGNFNVSEVDQVSSGASHPVGALDMNTLRADDEGNVWFWSEQGDCCILPSGKIRLVFKERLLDEFKNINNRDATNAFNFRSIDSQADWASGTVGSNLSTSNEPGNLTYKYPGTSTQASSTLQHSLGGFYAAGQPWAGTPYANDNDFSATNGSAVNANYIEAGASWFICCRATQDIKVTTAALQGRKGDGLTQRVSASVYQYKYQFGRKGSFLTTETALIGARVDGGYMDHTGNTDDLKTWSMDFVSGVFVPKGEWFWIEFKNESIGRIKQRVGAEPPQTPGLDFRPRVALGQTVLSGTVQDNAGPQGWAPQIAVGYRTVDQERSETIATTAPTAALQRYGMFNATPPNFGAARQVRVVFQTSPDNITWDSWQDVYKAAYNGVGATPLNQANPFYVLPDYRPAGANGYPHKVQRLYSRFFVETALGSNYGADVASDADSKVSSAWATAFFSAAFSPSMSFSSESSFTEPYANDLWTSPVFDTIDTPIEWGRFVVSSSSVQQLITMQARTDSVSPLTTAWVDLDPNTIPTTTELPINGRYTQVRFLFTDDPLSTTGITSAINNFIFSWRLSSQTTLAPLVPPCSAFFDRYHLTVHALGGSRLNTHGWCVSPGIKISEWSNQTINCMCIYDGRLLAGRANYPKVSQLFDNDYQDDGAAYIQGYLETMPTDFSVDNVKSVSAGYVFSGCREFKGLPVLSTDVIPNVPTGQNPLDWFMVGIRSGSTDQMPSSLLPFRSAGSNFRDFEVLRYSRESHSTPLPVGVLAGDAFEFGASRQDAVLALDWTATTHSIRDRGKPGTVNVKRFPYITDIHIQCFLETYYGVQR